MKANPDSVQKAGKTAGGRTKVVEARVAADTLFLTILRAEKRNALSSAIVEALGAALADHCKDDTLKLAVLSGAGDKAFASGGDLRELSALRKHDEAMAMSETFRAVLDSVRCFPVPVIAALNGDALGGGAELAMACDLRIAATHVRVGFLQGKLAISTAWGGGIDLMRLLGSARALRLLGRAEILPAEEARSLGLIDAIAPANAGFATFVDQFCDAFRERTPRVMRAFKALAIAHRFGAGHDEMVAIETGHFAETWAHDDHWAAVEASLGQAGKA